MRPSTSRHAYVLALSCVVVLAAPALAQQRQDPAYVAMLAKDAPKSADHPLTRRYQGANLVGQNVKAFDEITLPSGPATGKTYDSAKRYSKVETLSGKVTRTVHLSPTGRSSLEVFVNYRDELAAKGFEAVYECAREACGESFTVLKYDWQRKETQIAGEGYEQTRNLTLQAMFSGAQDPRYALMKKASADGDIFVAVFAALNKGGSFGSFSELIADRVGVLTEVVEPRGLEKRMVTISAAEIGGKLASEGRAIFHNILFDFDKADIKPESAPQLAEMAGFLKANPQAKVFVVGHTDNKGGLDYNLALSGRRATAVANALATQFGVDAKRLTPRGLGPLAPIATNRTEDGQAKNRRVEMVEQ